MISPDTISMDALRSALELASQAQAEATAAINRMHQAQQVATLTARAFGADSTELAEANGKAQAAEDQARAAHRRAAETAKELQVACAATVGEQPVRRGIDAAELRFEAHLDASGEAHITLTGTLPDSGQVGDLVRLVNQAQRDLAGRQV
jgi:hypothetical protein